MTRNRTSLTIDEPVGDRFRSFQRDDETLTEFVDRVCDALEADDATGKDECETHSTATDLPDDVLTESHIDDIATAAAQKTTRDLESALRR